tara:strand:- start:13032 stop:14510 length:1479 start_codon:yes stop_codon:yes gene_type:complete
MSQVIPDGWLEQPIGNISNVVAGGTPKAGNPNNFAIPGSEIAWLTPADLSKYNSKSISHGARDLSKEGYDSSSAKLMPKGALLFSSRAPIGYVVIAENPICTNQGFKNFVFTKQVDSTYAYYYLKSIRDLAESLGSGTTFKELSGATAKTIPFRLAPLAEQKVIADKLDELLAQVESTKARLDAIPAILKSFRQSVLAAAVSGKLTEEWRGENTVESQNLELIKSSKEQLIAQKDCKKDLIFQEIEATFEVPSTWSFLALKTLAIKITDGEHKTPKRESSGRYLLSARNVRDGYLCLDNVDYVGEEEFKKLRKRCDPNKGDVLISCSGSVGRISLVDTDDKYVMVRSAALVKVYDDFLSNRFLVYVLQSPNLQKRIEQSSKSTAQSNLFLGPIKELEIPLPALKEQAEIVRRVEELLTFADKVEAQVNEAQTRVNNLTQSVLAKAFRGELTTDWRAANSELISGDNSAEALLKRIKSEREALQANSKVRKKK